MVRSLAYKSLKANKLRNRIAVIAIILTTLLFTSLFTVASGVVQSIQRGLMRQAGGDGHAVLKYITNEQYDKVKSHPIIKEISYCMSLCDDLENKAFLKRRTEFWYVDEEGLKLQFITLCKGHLPNKSNEVIADTMTLQLLGVPLEEGAPITLELRIRDQVFKRDFVLSGWWESDPIFSGGRIIGSKAYMALHQEELQNTYYTDLSMTGAISCYILFDNSFNLENKLGQVITESGFSVNIEEPNYIESNVNWSYLSTNFNGTSPELIAGIGFGCVIILIVGYLIIYNIFQVSVIRDTKFYGLLRAIGTTPNQLKRILRIQAYLLSVVGIPIGLAVGFICGKTLVPIVMMETAYGNAYCVTHLSPGIFIFSIAFSFTTVWISTFKPCRMVCRISPIEAMRYNISLTHFGVKKQKKGHKGAKIAKMALSNLGRHRKQTVLVVMSLSLSVILLSIVSKMAVSIDLEKFIARNSSSDFLIAHADYFNNDYYGEENAVSQEMIEEVRKLSGFEDGGAIYGGSEIAFSVCDPDGPKEHYNRHEEGNYYLDIYGMDEVPLQQLMLIDGEMEQEKLATGEYVLEGIQLDDYQRPEMDKKHFEVGERVTISRHQQVSNKEVIILGHVGFSSNQIDRRFGDYTFFMSTPGYKQVVDSPTCMNYSFNVIDGAEQKIEDYLKHYTEVVEPQMNYSSRSTIARSCENIKRMVLLAGGALAVIVAVISLINLLNAILTSIIIRRNELAMLESIGMTKRQIKWMLALEGCDYALLTTLVVLIVGGSFTKFILSGIIGSIWFMTYREVIWPVVVLLIIFFVFGIGVSYFTYEKIAKKESIVDRMRCVES